MSATPSCGTHDEYTSLVPAAARPADVAAVASGALPRGAGGAACGGASGARDAGGGR
nr:hypothetical protein [Mycobacterium avium]